MSDKPYRRGHVHDSIEEIRRISTTIFNFPFSIFNYVKFSIFPSKAVDLWDKMGYNTSCVNTLISPGP